MDSDEEKEELELIEEKEEDNELTEDQELQHPVAVHIPNQQLAAEKNIADTVAVVHSSPNNESFPLMVSGTSFNLPSFSFCYEQYKCPSVQQSDKSETTTLRVHRLFATAITFIHVGSSTCSVPISAIACH